MNEIIIRNQETTSVVTQGSNPEHETNESNTKTPTVTKEPSFLVSVRFLLSFMLFLGIGLQFLQRTNMSIAIVCMVDTTATTDAVAAANTTANNETLQPYHHHTDGKFDWSKSTQGLILSSYFYGYMLTQIPSGWLCLKYGPKMVIGVGILGSSLATILSAPAAQLSFYWLIALRFLTGLFHV
jgi:MFS family permease